MTVSVHHRIKLLLEETNDAFSTYGSMNADFAEFATLALSDFKNILRNPALTDRQLKSMLRKGMIKSKGQDPDRWSAFMAKHVAKTANKNVKQSAKAFAFDLEQTEKA